MVRAIAHACDTYIASFDSLRIGNYHAYSTATTDGSRSVSSVPTSRSYVDHEHHLARVQQTQDPAMLSLIAASASNLEASMPRGTEEKQNHENSSKSTTSQHHLASGPIVARFETPGPSNSAENPATGSPLHTATGNPASETSALDDVSKCSNQSSGKPPGRARNVRGKFTDSRRQEVKSIRKKGACIRCRMLRKTVSIRCSSQLFYVI